MTAIERIQIQRLQAFPFLECVTGPPTPYTSARHFHEELEIAVNQGRKWHEICRGQTYHVPPEALLLTLPEDAHIAFSDETGSAPYFGLRIVPNALRSSLTEMLEQPQSFPFFRNMLVSDPTFLSLLLAFYHAVQMGHSSRLEQDDLWQRLVAALHRLSTTRTSFPSLRQEPQAVRMVKSYLQEQYQANVSLHHLAHLAKMSTFALTRSFHAVVGLPPHAYQTQIRILRAKRFLWSGYPLGEVALLVGFHNQSHFGRHFKRLIGITPGQYAHDCHQP